MKKKYTRKTTVQQLTKTALFAAIYASLTLLFTPLSYGIVQFRFSEALTVFAIFAPWITPALTLGCFIANLIGFISGQTFVWDLFVGPLATFLAGLLSYRFRNIRIKQLPLLSAAMPALLNGLMIGSMLTVLLVQQPTLITWGITVLSVAIGEVVVCFLVGLPLTVLLEKMGLDQKIFSA